MTDFDQILHTAAQINDLTGRGLLDDLDAMRAIHMLIQAADRQLSQAITNFETTSPIDPKRAAA